jgi:hypothetical protein
LIAPSFVWCCIEPTISAKFTNDMTAEPLSPSKRDLALAKICLNCPVCRRSRKLQKGAAFWLTSKVESRLCPFCRAYERVCGRKAHEPLSK